MAATLQLRGLTPFSRACRLRGSGGVMAEKSITEQFVESMLGIRYESIPPEAIEVSKQVVLDGLAVMHAGSREPLGVGRISTAYVREMGGAAQASVVAGG